jgi:hypothetical protein
MPASNGGRDGASPDIWAELADQNLPKKESEIFGEDMITMCERKDAHSISAGLQGNVIGFDDIKCVVVKMSPRGGRDARDRGADGSAAVRQPIPHYSEPISNPIRAIDTKSATIIITTDGITVPCYSA